MPGFPGSNSQGLFGQASQTSGPGLFGNIGGAGINNNPSSMFGGMSSNPVGGGIFGGINPSSTGGSMFSSTKPTSFNAGANPVGIPSSMGGSGPLFNNANKSIEVKNVDE